MRATCFLWRDAKICHILLTQLAWLAVPVIVLGVFFAGLGVHGAATAGSPPYPGGHPARVEAVGVAPDVLAKRDGWMKLGAADLAAGNNDAAATAFETAVSMMHAPDAELGLVRSYMQAGKYRQALSYAAHTAGAHKEALDGTALYVWLLYLGGQEAAAKRILFEAQARTPGDAVLQRTQRWMAASLSSVPGRPEVAGAGGPSSQPRLNVATAVMSGSGVLIDGGRHAMVPLGSVAHARKIWLRNGLGQLRKATVEKRFQQDGIALLKLDQPLPLSDVFMTAGRDPFPGSVVHSVTYRMGRGAQPDWPVLRHGFLGSPVGNGPDWDLGIAMPAGPHGGPVFDASGSLAGMSIATPHGTPMFLPINRIRRAIGDSLGPAAPAMNGRRIGIEQVYENAMGVTVQILTA